MNTLLNGSLHEEEAASSRVGVTSDILPEATNPQKGVSVRYVQSPDNDWYVLRASYGREVKARDLLLDLGIYAHVAQRWEVTEVAGKRRKVLVSLLPNLLFAYLPKNRANLFVKGLPPISDGYGRGCSDDLGLTREEQSRISSLAILVSYYYDHFKEATHDAGKNPPLVVKENEMTSFIKATSTNNEHLKVVDMDKVRFLKENQDKMVEVIRGDYKGVKGRVARVSGQQCIVVSVANGRWNISTEYIPTAYIRPLG